MDFIITLIFVGLDIATFILTFLFIRYLYQKINF